MATVTITRPVPQSVQMWQLIDELNSRNLLALVHIKVRLLPDKYQIIWENSSVISRNAPALTTPFASLSWASNFIDEIFISASRRRLEDSV